MSEVPGAADGPADRQGWGGGWRRLLVSLGMLVYPFVTAAGILQYSSGPNAAMGYTATALFAACYVVATFLAVGGGLRSWPFLAVMTALFLVTLPSAREYAFYLCAVVLSLVSLRIGRRVVPLVVAGVVASIVVPWAVPGWNSGPGYTQAIMIVFTVLMTFAFGEMAKANRSLLEARAEIVRLASEAERNRIARDLHDLVGHSLTAITVKSNLARQLAEAEGSPALAQIADVERLSRQTLADVRAAVTGYHDVTLAGELARSRELLRASGITPDLPTAVDGLDGGQQELFGWAVREGVTNVLRHARASRCTVTLTDTAVEIRDDGVGVGAGAGNGIDGLRERAAAAGGVLEAGPVAPHGWRLSVTLARQGQGVR